MVENIKPNTHALRLDSFKEKDKLALKPSKRPRIEAAEEPMRRMISYLESHNPNINRMKQKTVF